MCYISVNHEDGSASLEVVHEALPNEAAWMNNRTCVRCEALYVEIDKHTEPFEITVYY